LIKNKPATIQQTQPSTTPLTNPSTSGDSNQSNEDEETPKIPNFCPPLPPKCITFLFIYFFKIPILSLQCSMKPSRTK
jgi:hypothetical protein